MFTCSKAEFQKGQSLIEVIVAGLVGILVVSALTFATIFSIRNANFAKTSAQATKLAQEGMERVRTGRDRNSNITGITGVNSWNGDTAGSGAFWNYHISGDCDNPAVSGKCYFKVTQTGDLNNIGFSLSSFPTDSAEPISPGFKRAVYLSDDLNDNGIFTDDDYLNQKEVTVIVTWTDSTGSHESKLTTVLRKL